MKRLSHVIAMALICFLIVGFLYPSQVKSQQNEQTTIANAKVQQEEVYACPMHPEVRSNKPGKCSKCGMDLVKQSSSAKQTASVESQSQTLSPAEKIAKAKALLNEAKATLMEENKYNCCIENPCNTCAFEHQSCGCYESLKAGKAVCNECYAGWQRGEGADKDIKPSQVKTTYGRHKH